MVPVSLKSGAGAAGLAAGAAGCDVEHQPRQPGGTVHHRPPPAPVLAQRQQAGEPVVAVGHTGEHFTGDRLTAIGDDDFLAGLHRFDQLRETVFRFENIDLQAASPGY